MADYEELSSLMSDPEMVQIPAKEAQGASQQRLPVPVPVPVPVSVPLVAGFGSPAPASSPAPHPTNKVLDFGVKQAADPPTTPTTPFTLSSSTEVSPRHHTKLHTRSILDHLSSPQRAPVDYNQFLLETLLWRNKVRSTLYFVLGLAGLLGLKYAVSAQATLLSSVGYVLLLSLFVNFMRAIISPPVAGVLQVDRLRPRQLCAVSASDPLGTFFCMRSSVKATLSAVFSLHDAHFNGQDPVKTLQVAVGLWSVALLGRHVSGINLLVAGFLLAFTLPVLYAKFRRMVDKTLGDVLAQVQAKYSALDRRSKAGVVLGPLALLMMLLSNNDRCAALFLFLVYGRLLLKPVEFEAITKRVEPITATAKRLGSAASHLALGFADKHSLTPTPTKKKSQ
ncbi:MAG: hypothetical protein WDW36_004185 [Sanguina aurantia]